MNESLYPIHARIGEHCHIWPDGGDVIYHVPLIPPPIPDADVWEEFARDYRCRNTAIVHAQKADERIPETPAAILRRNSARWRLENENAATYLLLQYRLRAGY